MKHLTFICLLLWGCAEQGSGPVPVKVVPNETPEQFLEPVPIQEQASKADLLALQEIQELETDSEENSQSGEDQPQEDLPQDLRNLSAEERRQAARSFRQNFLTPKPLKPRLDPEAVESPAPTSGFQMKPLPADPLTRDRQAVPRPEKAKPAKPAPRAGGGRFFQAPPANAEEARAARLFPPGKFLRARLTGNISVSLFSPVIWAEILDEEGTLVGTAVGNATLHRFLRDRALIQFSQIHLNDGTTLRGDFTAFDLDLSQGLRGTVVNRRFKKFVHAMVGTFLGALSLEVETGGDAFADYFRFQFANNLIDQSRQELEDLNLNRLIHIPRGTEFWVASIREGSLRKAAYTQALDTVASGARDAFQHAIQSQTYADDRKQALEQAYQRLERRLQDLP